MLKTVSSVTNAIGALNYKGTWNATTNTPTITSSVGVKGDYYQVSVAGSTTINGISNWGVGDVIAFNGVVWQRIEGGADLNGVDLSVSGTTTLSGLTASTALALDANKNVVSVTNTGTGDNVLATSPTLVTPTLGAATATSINGLTVTSTTGTLTLANGSTLATSGGNSLTFTTTGATNVTLPTTGTLATTAGTVASFSGGTTGLTPNTATTGAVTLGGTLAASNGGTGLTALGTGVATWLGTPTSANLAAAVTDETGTGALVFANSPTLVTPALGTPSSATLTNATGLPTAGLLDNAVTDVKLRDSAALSVIGRSANTTGDPADIAAGTDHQVLRRSGTALGFGAVALNQANAITGTLPVGNGGTGITSLGTGVATFLGTPTSANLAAAVTDETGSGVLVFGTSPSLTTPRVITAINDTNGNELFGVTATTSAVNELTVANAATGNNPVLSATGSDTNIGINITAKGTGGLQTNNSVSVGGATPSTSGAGFTFPATQSASSNANTLDDYEEGTHSPSATPTSGSFTTVTQSGSYVKIGQLVNYSFIVTINSVGTGSGDVNIVLPFVCNLTPIRPMGSGRENALTGNTLQVRTASDGSANATILGGGALGNSWQALCTITYQTTA